jgi:hypothetical protein
MIIVDFSGISLSTVFSQSHTALNENLLRHMILNSLRMYNIKYRDEYGKMILACDSGSWRKRVFPQYKACRKKNREDSNMDWDNIFEIINKVKDEIATHLPFPVLQVNGAEADDIIATLVASTQQFGSHEEVMIISADKDFIQLQQYSNVKQFSPMTKKLVKDPSPARYLFEHIVRGDGGDGVPNILSSDTVFVDEDRQTPLRSTQIETWYKASKTQDMKQVLDDKTYRNYLRNKAMIDLSAIPADVAELISAEIARKPVKPNTGVLNYLISNRCNQLVPCAQEFFIK